MDGVDWAALSRDNHPFYLALATDAKHHTNLAWQLLSVGVLPHFHARECNGDEIPVRTRFSKALQMELSLHLCSSLCLEVMDYLFHQCVQDAEGKEVVKGVPWAEHIRQNPGWFRQDVACD
jgi:hypothetical protein